VSAPVQLSSATLAGIAASGVPVPTYDRAAVRVGIVHLGVGGFHRAHQAVYVDELMNRGSALEWGICGVGVLPGDARMRDVLDRQDGLYTLVLKAPDGTWTPRVVGSIVEYLLAPDDPDVVVEKMADPATRVVSLTVTEGGYNIHGGHRGVRPPHPRRGARPHRRRGTPDVVRARRGGAAAASGPGHRAVHRQLV